MRYVIYCEMYPGIYKANSYGAVFCCPSAFLFHHSFLDILFLLGCLNVLFFV